MTDAQFQQIMKRLDKIEAAIKQADPYAAIRAIDPRRPFPEPAQPAPPASKG